MRRLLDSLQPWGALLLRLALGASMLYHGYDKVIPAHGLRAHSLSAMQHYNVFIASLGVPAWLGYVSALTEFLGGVFLLLGFLTRLAALMVAGNMIVALVTVNVHHGFAGSEYTLALIAIALMLLFTGAGVFSLDRRIGLG